MPFDPYVIAEGEVVSVGGVLWTNLGSGPGEMFPSITLQVDWTTPSSYTIVSNFPQTQDGREIAVQALRPSGWYDIWRGNEDDLPATINTLGLTINDVRARYTLANECEYFADGVVVCSPAEDQSVVNAVPVSDRATIEGDSPAVGDAYLVISGAADGIWTTNTIQTWNGTGWTQSPVVTGRIIATEQTPPSYWITPSGYTTPGDLFPFISIEFDPGTTQYTVQSLYPFINAIMGRKIAIYAIDGETSTTLFEGPETAIVNPLVLTAEGVGADGLALMYFSGYCQWLAGSQQVPPISCLLPRDHNCEDHNSLDHS